MSPTSTRRRLPRKPRRNDESAEALGELRGEAEPAAVVAHPAEPGDRGDPGSGHRGDVQAVARVVLEVADVHQGCLAEVVVGQLEVAGLGSDDRLDAGRERRVAYGQLLVVGEVAGLLLGGERVAAGVEREHEIGLLDDLLAVEVEVGEVAAAAGTARASCGRNPISRGG